MTPLHAPPASQEQELRSQLRAGQVVIAAAASAALLALDLPLWAPAPVLLALLDRHLRPWVWSASGATLDLADTLTLRGGAAPPVPLVLAEVRAATRWRRAYADHDELHVVLWTADRAWHLVALTPPGVAATDLDEVERHLGGLPGWERTLAPAEAGLPPVRDPHNALVGHLDRALPVDARDRLAARGWRVDRAQPDPAGLLPSPHDDLLWVDAATWRWGAEAGDLIVQSVHGATRRQPVWSGPRDRPVLAPLDVDVLVIGVAGGLHLVVPTPAAARAPRGALPPTAIAAHTAEVAPILLRLLQADPEGLLVPLLTPAVL